MFSTYESISKSSNQSTAMNVMASFSRNKMRKSIASATKRFHKGAIRNSLQYSRVFLAKTWRRAAATVAAAVGVVAVGCCGDV